MRQKPISKYQRAVNWIAFNDDDAVLDVLQIEEFVTVALVADWFGKSTDQVAEDVLRARKANQ